LVDSLKVKNVLELSQAEQTKINEIRDFMQEQADGLKKEIDEIQGLIMKASMEDNEPQLTSSPSQKDL